MFRQRPQFYVPDVSDRSRESFDRDIDRLISVHAKTDRPELSPCLARLADQRDPRYREALAIVRAGHDMLRVRPSTELPGFQLCTSTELAQEAKYRSLRQAEAESRQAIVRGEKRHESHR